MSISRRKFLEGLAGAGAAAAVSSRADASTIKHYEGYEGRYGLLHDTTLCVGCRSCEAACKEVNHLPPPDPPLEDQSVFEKKRRVTPDSFTVVNRYVEASGGKPAVYRKHQCMHCNEPCCASVCPVGAFSKTPEGPVLYHPELCMGCRYCVMACPYYALSYEYDHPFDPKVMRCTMCYPRIKEGKNPACADACPTGAILFGKREELLEVARDRIRKHPDRYLNHVFGEHEFGGTSWLILAGVSFAKLDLHEGVTHTPLPEIGTGFLSVVPLVITIYPGLLAGIHAFTKRREKVAKKEQAEAVAKALARADEETKEKLAAAAKKAEKAKERAVKAAERKARAEVEKELKAKIEALEAKVQGGGAGGEGTDQEDSK